MKICPDCGRNFPDEYGFCLDDGVPLSEPLAGEATAIIKGPYPDYLPKTELLAAEPPAPTVASSPSPSSSETLEAYKPKIYPDVTEPERRLPIAVWVAASVFATVVVIGAIYLLLLRPTNMGGTQTVSAVNNGQTPATTVATPDILPSAAGSVQPTPEPPSSIVASGKTQAYTREYPIESQNDRAYISRWDLSEGQLYDQCKTPQLGTQTHTQTIVLAGGGYRDEQFSEEIRFDAPAIIEKIYVRPGEQYDSRHRLMTVGKIDDIFVYATLTPADIERVAKRAKAFFTTPDSKGRFTGTVDMVDKTSSTIRVALDHSEIFDKDGCLNIYPDRTGELTIALSDKL
jgi:hypothetical protein